MVDLIFCGTAVGQSNLIFKLLSYLKSQTGNVYILPGHRDSM